MQPEACGDEQMCVDSLSLERENSLVKETEQLPFLAF